MNSDYSMGWIVLFLAIAVIVYFIPNWIACARKHHNANAIFVTNLLLGWTALGWVIALVWSLTAVKNETSENAENRSESKQCPFCAELIKVEAIICKHCGKKIPKPKNRPSAINSLNDNDLEAIEWKCNKCGEISEGQFSECWQCGASRP